MRNFYLRPVRPWLWPVALVALVGFAPDNCRAIEAGQLDDFQDGTSQGWTINNGAVPVFVAQNEGPSGEGDHALLMSTTFTGRSRLVVTNVEQWKGNWTGEAITRVSLDVRNPNTFDLSMRLGIAGPGGFGPGGVGDTHVTDIITVPADNAWHPLEFDVLADDFTALGGTSTSAALMNVTHFRVIHSDPISPFIGALVDGGFYLDNIRAIGGSSLPDGDYNGDGLVDAADYVVWRKADGTQPGYDLWRANFGSAATGAGSALAAVPEPAAWLIAFAAVLLVMSRGVRIC